MSSLKNRLHGTRQELDELVGALGVLTQKLGRANLSLKQIGETGTEELRKRALEAGAAVEEIESKSGMINRLLAEREQLEGDMEENGGRRKELSERRRRLSGEIGRKVFELFTQGKLDDGLFAPVFAELSEKAERVRQLEADIKEYEEARENSPLLKKIPFGAKISIARNTISGIRREQEKLWFKAGESLANRDLLSSVEDSNVLPLSAAFREAGRGLEEADAEAIALKEKLEAVGARLEAAGADKSGSKRLRELEQQREEAVLRKEEAEKDFGAALLLMPELRELLKKEGDASLLGEIGELESREEELRATAAALESGIAAEEKQEELEKQRKQLEKLAEKKLEIETGIKALKKAVAENEKEIERLREAAGSVL